MQLIGLYKTDVAAHKAKSMMNQSGIPEFRTSLLAPDDTTGPHLAMYAGSSAARLAWWGAGAGTLMGALLFALIAQVQINWLFAEAGEPSRLGAALLGVAVGGALGALTGGIVGMRQTVLYADFFESDDTRGGTALGVVAETAEEAETARHAFRSTGALEVRTGASLPTAAEPSANRH